MKVLELLEGVAPHTYGAPEPIMATAYVDAVRQFCQDTHAWVSTEPEIVHTIGFEFEIEHPVQTSIIDARAMRYGKRELLKQTYEQIQHRSMPGGPVYYRVAAGRLFVYDVPEDIAKLKGRFILQPRRHATVIDDGLVDRHQEAFEHGALARLLLQPNKAWTDYESAAAYRTMFREYVDEWKGRAPDEGMVNVSRRVRYGGY